MRLKPPASLLPAIAALAVASLLPVSPAEAREETKEEKDARMAWFREARFGMFIHWGLYAIPAGEWNGKKPHENVEWIQSQAEIPVAEYSKLKDRFNPVKYDPEAWVKLAKNAGMKYIVLTTKHHDGFGLWDSAQTEWDVASTPYGKDLIKPLAEACARHGIRLCFYHSIMDWHHPEYGNKAPWRGNAATPEPDMDKYTAYMKAQLKELLTGYGDIGVVWFDGEWESSWTHERGIDLYNYVRSLQPGTIVNNRVDKGRTGMAGMTKEGEYRGDFGTPEQEIPANGLPGVDWEACMTMNNTWGYSAHDQNWKSAETLLRNLVDIASKGGNYLLNVGPTAEGEIPAASIERLQAIGAWMQSNGDAVIGTQASPFPRPLPWGRCTRKALPDGNTRLFLHVFDWPQDGVLTVSGLQNDVISASFLARPGQKIPSSRDNGKVSLQLGGRPSDPGPVVVALDISGQANVQPVPLRPGADGVLQLNAEDAQPEGQTLRLETRGSESNIGWWTNPADAIAFPVVFEKGGVNAVVLRWSCAEAAAGSRIEVRLHDKDNQVVSTLPWTVASTGQWSVYQSLPIGVLAVPAAGNYTLRVVAVDKKGEGVLNFATLRLQPAE